MLNLHYVQYRSLYNFSRTLIFEKCLRQRSRPNVNNLDFRTFGNSLCSLQISKFSSERLHNERISSDEKPSTSLLKIAIIGVPNSGKSTFINQIVGRRVR